VAAGSSVEGNKKQDDKHAFAQPSQTGGGTPPTPQLLVL
jgi:hypothetical protein